jgi:hypothetical protein
LPHLFASETTFMTHLIEIRIFKRGGVAALALAVMAVGATSSITPAMADGRHFYDDSYYRPVHGRARNIFRNPVGKLNPGVTRRLPPLDVKPSEFDFGIKPIKIDSPDGSAAKARRTGITTPTTPLLPDLSAPKKTTP